MMSVMTRGVPAQATRQATKPDAKPDAKPETKPPAAVTGGARSVPAVQEATRCGMGYCQGRVCGPALQYAVSAAVGRSLAQ